MPTTRTRRRPGIDWEISPSHRTDALVFVAYWVFASPFILSSLSQGDAPLDARDLVYYAWMVVAYTTGAWVTANVLFPSLLTQRRYFAAMMALLGVLLLISTGTYWIVDVAIYHTEDSWWHATLNFNVGNDAQNLLTIVAILAGKKFYDEKQHSLRLESERHQAQLQQLRAQVDPHFLFNSLNILDILIDDDPAEAKAFVHRLSNLYRYLIRHRNEDLVPAAEELAYAKDYHYLVERRFGAAFHFRENLTPVDLEGRVLPPGALQTVLENVYKHNLATERRPVTIQLDLRRDAGGAALYVTNDFAPKPGELATHERSGSGTANLVKRYGLLTDREAYARRDGAYWVVRLPLLALHTDSTPHPSTPHPSTPHPSTPHPGTPHP